MHDFLSAHPYFFANIPMLVAILVGVKYNRPRDVWRLVVPAGLLNIPSSLIAFTFEGDYWTPDRLGGLMIGAEDLVFCVVAGALAWLVAAWPFRHRVRSTVRWRAAMTRYAALGLLGGVVIIGFHLGDRHSMTGFAVASLLVLATVLILRRELWILAPSGAAFYSAVHVSVVRLQFWIWPDYVSFWNHEGLLGSTIAGVPLFEFVWSAVFGGVWPVVVAFVFDLRFKTGTAHHDLTDRG
jgi:lysylphosphatidylglycerol synthetase-like protein (DUF2156 family)